MRLQGLIAGGFLPLLLLHLPPPPKPSGSFGPVTTYAVGLQPRALALADVNGDGRLDIVTANEAKSRALPGGTDNYAIGAGALLPHIQRRAKAKDVGSVSVLLAQPAGGFARAQTYSVGRFPTGVAVSDINQDGRPDIVTADADFFHGYTLTVLLGQEGGGFTSPVAYPSRFLRSAEALVLADITGDDRPEALSANDLPNEYGDLVNSGLQVLPALSAPATGFGPAVGYPIEHYSPRSLALADVTGDGRPDALVTEGEGFAFDSTVVLLPGRANGKFGAPLAYIAEKGPTAVADINNDGYADLVAVSVHATSVRLGGRQGLGPATRHAGASRHPLTAVLSDVNGDRHPDLLTNYYSYEPGATGQVTLRLGLTAGGWGAPVMYSTGTHSAERFTVGDVNDDGRPDLVTLNRNTNTVGVLLGR